MVSRPPGGDLGTSEPTFSFGLENTTESAQTPPKSFGPGLDAAIECAARAARRFGMTRHRFRRAIVGTARQLERYDRVLYRIERRGVVLRTAPVELKSRGDYAPLPHPGRVAPWKTRSDALRAKTQVECLCPTCHGVKRSRCQFCWVSSTLSGALPGCERCRDGLVACPKCQGLGAVEAWLEVNKTVLELVRAQPDFIAKRLHPSVLDPADFDRTNHPSQLVRDTGWTRPKRADVRALPGFDPYQDRILAVRRQSFIVTTYSITYRTLQGRGTVEVAGYTPRVLPLSNWKPLELRLRIAALATLLYLLGLAGVAGYHAASPAQLTTWAEPTLWALGWATLLLLTFRSRAVWSWIRRVIPPHLGGTGRSSPLGEGLTSTYGTR